VAEEAHRLRPRHPGAWLLLTKAQFAAGRRDEARESARALVQAYPDYQEARYQHGLALAAAGLGDDARKELQRSLELNPSHVPSRLGLVELEREVGNIEEAARLAREIQELSAEAPLGYQLEGDSWMQAGRPADAVRPYERALEIRKALPAVVRLAAARAASGAPQAGVDLLTAWMAENPDDLAAREALGDVYLAGGDLDRARAEYERVAAAQKAPHPLTLNRLAWVYERQGDPRSLKLVEEAYRLAPESAAVLDTYGWILYRGGETERAITYLQRAVDRERSVPGLADRAATRFHLAAALAKGGDGNQARRHLEAALASGAQFPDRAEALKLQDLLR
jgi:putative PEP-CTERM system TPR-repeat lipoprotein